MKVSGLLEALESMPQDAEVWMYTDCGGHIAEVRLETYKKFNKDVTQVILADKKHTNWKPEAQCSDPGCYVCRKPEPLTDEQQRQRDKLRDEAHAENPYLCDSECGHLD